ncbi:MAG: ABC transporter ATP-binding protein [Phycisphaerae bacterium]|nr:ABC transporter ATP-binding protein [Phycisphaerae bacterium]
MSETILEVDAVTMRFGGLVANENVSFAVGRGQIFAVIGPNGAGKTTLFNAITGIYQPTAGRVLFRGQEIVRGLGGGAVLRAVIVGLLTAFGLLVALHISDLWSKSIDDNYEYGEAFPYAAAVRSFFATLGGHFTGWGLVPVALGFVIGAAASFALSMNARRAPDLIARAGIARTFQNIRLFAELDLVENVLVGMDSRLKTGYWHALLRLPRFFHERRVATGKAMELLRFVELDKKAMERAKNLPYGHQRRLEIARALASEPQLLLLDEPAAGMNPAETVDLMRLIRKVRDRGVTVVLIEHHMRVVMGISDRIVVLQYGKKIAEGTPDEIKCDERCIEAYLGKEELG